MKKNYLSIALLILFTFACSLFTPPHIEPQPITPEVAQPEVEIAPLPEIDTAVLPIGVVTEKDGVFSLFDQAGYTLMQANVPGFAHADQNYVHIASAGNTQLAVLYYSFEKNNSLMVSNKGQITTLVSAQNFFGMVGAQGKPIVAYTTVEYAEESLVSHLFVGDIQSLPVIQPILNESDSQGWALVALAVDVDGNQPSGIWYSKSPWGIGGDIVFTPRRTLSYRDLRTGAVSRFLGAEATPSSISTDRKWLAYTSDSNGEMSTGVMTIRNLQTGETFSFPLQNMTDSRGAGEASFSPNNQYVAWTEGYGWQLAETPNFHSIVRVGNLNGNLIAEFADTFFQMTSGLSTVQRVEPVGWFDDNTLVVMARGEDWDKAVLAMVDIPSKTSKFLAQGVFMGFVYP